MSDLISVFGVRTSSSGAVRQRRRDDVGYVQPSHVRLVPAFPVIEPGDAPMPPYYDWQRDPALCDDDCPVGGIQRPEVTA